MNKLITSCFLFLLLATACEKSGGANAGAEEVLKTRSVLCDLTEQDPLVARIKYFEGTDSLSGLLAFRDSVDQDGVYFAYATYRLGAMYSSFHRDSSNYFYDVALEAFSNTSPLVVERIGTICKNLASSYSEPGKKRVAAMRGIKVLLEHADCDYDPTLLPELHQYVGQVLAEQKDIIGALRYLRSGLSLCTESTPAYAVANLYNEYGNALIEAGENDAAIAVLDSAQSKILGQDKLIAWDSFDLANLYDTYHVLEKSRGQEFAAREKTELGYTYRRTLDPDGIMEAHSCNNLGRLYLLDGDYLRGGKLLQKAIRLYTENDQWMARGSSYESLAMGNLRRGDTIQALSYLDSAEIAYQGYLGSTALTYAVDKAELQDALMTRARLMARLHGSRPTKYPLRELRRALNRLDSISNALRYQVRTEGSKRLVIGELRDLYDTVIQTGMRRYQETDEEAYLELALEHLEKGKAEVLRERRTRSMRQSPENYSMSVSDSEARSTEIKKYRTLLRDTPRTAERQRIHREIIRLEEEDWREKEEAYLSQMVTAENNSAGSALRKIATTLDDDAAVLDYFIGKDAVFVAIAINAKVTIRKLPVKPTELKELVGSFNRSVRAPINGKKWRSNISWREERIQELGEISHRLYQDLVAAAFAPALPPHNLTVIADGEIGAVPIGALVTEAPALGDPPGKWSFVAHHHTINYDFSARMWFDRTQQPKSGSSRVLVIAPEQSRMRSVAPPVGDSIPLFPLINVSEEVAAVQSGFNAKAWRGEEAEKMLSVRDFSEYGIIHFAGHGVAFPSAPEYSFLAIDFPDNGPPKLLRLPMLEANKMPVELLVLSACQTGVGEVAPEEGVISLARAGALAGANSVVASFWSVTQRTKPYFFEHYYRALARGAGRAEAVAMAQRAVFDQRSQQQHPFYWAAFYNLGERAALPASFLSR